MEAIRNKLSKAEWLEHISDLCVITLRELQEREDHLTEEDWKLADLCGGYIHAYNLLKENHLINPVIMPQSDFIH